MSLLMFNFLMYTFIVPSLIREKDFITLDTPITEIVKKLSDLKFLKGNVRTYFFRVAPYLLCIHFLRVVRHHATKSYEPAYNYLDPGYVARYAITKDKPWLLKGYLNLGGNPNFRDEYLMVLFEYAYLKQNTECGALLLQYEVATSKDGLVYDAYDYQTNQEFFDSHLYLASPLFKFVDWFSKLLDRDKHYKYLEASENWVEEIDNFAQLCRENDQNTRGIQL